MEYFIIITIIALLSISPIFFDKDKRVLEKTTYTTRQLMYIVSMSAISIVVGVFEIPIGLTGVKFDFSEVVILITFLLLGFKGTSLTIIFRSLIRFILPAKTAAEAHLVIKLIGEVVAILASFLIVFSYILVKKLLKKKEKPLLIAVPTSYQKVSKLEYILNIILAPTFLLIGTTIFHILFTMPIYTSVLFPSPTGQIHLFITSFLKDSFYSDTFGSILIFILANFAILNIVKASLSITVFLLLKPRLTKIVK